MVFVNNYLVFINNVVIPIKLKNDTKFTLDYRDEYHSP